MVKKKVSNKGMNKNLVIGIVVVLLLIGVFWYFNNQKEVGLSPFDDMPDGGAELGVSPTSSVKRNILVTYLCNCDGKKTSKVCMEMTDPTPEAPFGLIKNPGNIENAIRSANLCKSSDLIIGCGTPDGTFKRLIKDRFGILEIC